MWIDPVNTIDLFIKGLLVGIVASAPMGPVGILCIQRTLNKGRTYGLITGVGAAFSDIVYAMMTGLGLVVVQNFISDNIYVLQIVGSVMLFAFGIYTFLSDPSHAMRPVSKNKGTLLHNMITAFLVTFSNPLIIFLFLALFARFTFVTPENNLIEQIVGYMGIFVGALLWWFVLSYCIDKVRAKFNVNGIVVINRIIGGLVMAVSAVGFIMTLSGLSL